MNPIHGTNTDQLSNTQMHTLPLDAVVNDHRTGADGNYLPERVISTISPVVVRQNDVAGPRYQEGLGYAFLLNAPKYPGLTQMDDGKLVLTLSAALAGGPAYGNDEGRIELLLCSEDEGMSWGTPRRIPGYRTTPMNLGGKRLLLRGWDSFIDTEEHYRFWFSDDGGVRWSAPEPVPPLPDGRGVNTDVAPSMLCEGDTIRFMFYAAGSGTLLRSYNHVQHTWGEPFFFPPEWMAFALSSEASLTRAQNGDLIVSLRSSRPGIPAPSDHWRAILTARSSDDGKTWTWPEVHSLYGHVHHSLLPFPDGRILMTYAARVGELDGRIYHGHEAVFSHDHGRSWDWQRRYILLRGTDGTMHSPQSVLLADGRVLTVAMHPISFTWKDEQSEGNVVGLSQVSTVIWTP
jgi:hypothetical protein